MKKKVSTIILGASKVEQLLENLESLHTVPLMDQKVMSQLDEIFPKPNLQDWGQTPQWAQISKK